MQKKKHKVALICVAAIVAVTLVFICAPSGIRYKVFPCRHESWSNGICSDCGEKCGHPDFIDGECATCGYLCDHLQYLDNGSCTVCGKRCAHLTFIKGVCSTCYYKCPHSRYENGRCQICGYKCTHVKYEDGVCSSCGIECKHGEYTDGICRECGYHCEHADGWNSEGDCPVCGSRCPHPSYENGNCTVCSVQCQHLKWINSTCTICNLQCDHPDWEDGACSICGVACEHENFEKSICTVCGFHCQHPIHNSNGECLVCGRFVTHDYFNSVCTTCGKPLMFTHNALPLSLFQSVPERGSTEYVYYPAVQYETGNAIVKRMHVYLPYGYSTEQKYDLLLLMPGLGDTEEKFFEETHYYLDGSERTNGVKDLLDYCIYTGVCEPMIVVSLSWEDQSGQEPAQIRDVRQVGMELRNDILPFLADNYSIYADNGSEEELIKNRAHVAYYGLSYGALMTHSSAITNCYDMIGWYTVTSTASENVAWAIESMKNHPELPLYFYMCGYSSDEISKPTTIAAYDKLRAACPEMINDSNSVEIEFENLGHTSDLFDAMIYNTLLIVFRE